MKRALIIGINYQTRRLQLNFAESDARKFKNFLESKYPEIQITTIYGPQATKEQILRALTRSVMSTKTGDTLFFYYSGHGVRVKDRNGDECDGQDEAILGYEARSFKDESAMITDDQFKNIIKHLPEGAVFRAVLDACHSGTMFDLKETVTLMETGEKLVIFCLPNIKFTQKDSGFDGMIFSSSVDSESSYEDSKGGIFTRHLLSQDTSLQAITLLKFINKALIGTQTPMLSSTEKSTNFQRVFFPH